jgi:hypothetical protein
MDGKVGGKMEETELVHGVIVDKDMSHPQMVCMNMGKGGEAGRRGGGEGVIVGKARQGHAHHPDCACWRVSAPFSRVFSSSVSRWSERSASCAAFA